MKKKDNLSINDFSKPESDSEKTSEPALNKENSTKSGEEQVKDITINDCEKARTEPDAFIKKNNTSDSDITTKAEKAKNESNDKTSGSLPDNPHKGGSTVQFIIAIITATIAGLVVAFLSPYIQDWHTAKKQIEEQDDSLEKIQIGLSKGHIDELFGNPLFINNVDADYAIEAGGNFCSAAYKLHEKSLLCLYQDETLVAYVVMTKKKDQFSFVPYGLYDPQTKPDTYTVSEFTYDDYNDSFITDFKGYYPIIGSYHIHYYYEISGGTHPDNYEYTILGTYRNYMDENDDVIELMSKADSLSNKSHHEINDSETLKKAMESLSELRRKIHPDVYGVSRYSEFNFVVDVIQNDDNSLLLTSDN